MEPVTLQEHIDKDGEEYLLEGVIQVGGNAMVDAETLYQVISIDHEHELITAVDLMDDSEMTIAFDVEAYHITSENLVDLKDEAMGAYSIGTLLFELNVKL